MTCLLGSPRYAIQHWYQVTGLDCQRSAHVVNPLNLLEFCPGGVPASLRGPDSLLSLQSGDYIAVLDDKNFDSTCSHQIMERHN